MLERARGAEDDAGWKADRTLNREDPWFDGVRRAFHARYRPRRAGQEAARLEGRNLPPKLCSIGQRAPCGRECLEPSSKRN
jgi:hypothetical protein